MSILFFAVIASVIAALDDAIMWKIKAVRMARRCPRARRYRFD
jgi:hypothetical protein